MTRLVARLILAMLLLPLSGAVFVLSLFGLASTSGLPPDKVTFLGVWAVTLPFIALYWVLLWWGVVRWNRRRVLLTAGSGIAALAVGGLIGSCLVAFGRLPVDAAVVIGGGCSPIAWVLATVLIWRETPAERAARMRGITENAVCCPICGYNLTGLREARCPECGGRFTLDQLLAAAEEPQDRVLNE